jgi:hypothetical protein
MQRGILLAPYVIFRRRFPQVATYAEWHSLGFALQTRVHGT